MTSTSSQTTNQCYFANAPIPLGSRQIECKTCAKLVSVGDVLRCKLNGPKKKKPTKEKVGVTDKLVGRVDWFEDYPCTYRAGEPQQKTCGCGGTGVVYVMDCTETTGKSCVATELQRKGLLKKHPDLYHSVRVCEDCPLNPAFRCGDAEPGTVD